MSRIELFEKSKPHYSSSAALRVCTNSFSKSTIGSPVSTAADQPGSGPAQPAKHTPSLLVPLADLPLPFILCIPYLPAETLK